MMDSGDSSDSVLKCKETDASFHRSCQRINGGNADISERPRDRCNRRRSREIVASSESCRERRRRRATVYTSA